MSLSFNLYLLVLHHTISICSSEPVWETAPTTLPIPLSIFAVGSYDDSLYIVGGVTDEFGATPNNSTYYLAQTQDIFSQQSQSSFIAWPNSEWPLPGSLCCFDTNYKDSVTIHSQGYAQSHSLLFVVPYISSQDKPTVLLIFDMQRKAFKSPMEYRYQSIDALSDPCVVSTDTNVYLIGGVSLTNSFQIEWKATVQIYAISNDTWRMSIHSINIARRSSACAILGTNVYLFGGRSSEGHLGSIERFKFIDDLPWQILSSAHLLKKDEEIR